jgi:transcriptional regulator with XRE-family HTH domain
MATLRKRFGQKILSIRKECGMTQECFAEKLDISVDFLSLIERGINAPSFETLEKMVKKLRLHPKDLFDFK